MTSALFLIFLMSQIAELVAGWYRIHCAAKLVGKVRPGKQMSLIRLVVYQLVSATIAAWILLPARIASTTELVLVTTLTVLCFAIAMVDMRMARLYLTKDSP